MAKKVIGEIKLQIPAGQANPSPPVGPALGQRGVNIMEFCKAFNAATQGQPGMIIPVIVTVYADRSRGPHPAQAFSTCANSSSTGVERPKISTATRNRLFS